MCDVDELLHCFLLTPFTFKEANHTSFMVCLSSISVWVEEMPTNLMCWCYSYSYVKKLQIGSDYTSLRVPNTAKIRDKILEWLGTVYSESFPFAQFGRHSSYTRRKGSGANYPVMIISDPVMPASRAVVFLQRGLLGR